MKTERKRLWMQTIVSSMLIAAIVGGCKKDDFVETVEVCPDVLTTSPIAGATGVPLDKTVTITFTKKMNPSTITGESFTLETPTRGAAAIITGALSYDGTTATMSFNPSAPLKANTVYTGRVSQAIKDLAGNALRKEYVWSFTTGATLAPTVISTNPANNATGVVLSIRLLASFSVPMDPSTLNATTFILKQGTTAVAGTVSHTGTTASFTPNVNLLANTLYTATITTGVKSVPGTALKSDYVWSFTTGTTVTPKVISTDPINLATGVSLNKIISANFSEAMNPLTITASTFTIMNGSTPILGVVTYAGTKATFTPNSNLLSGVTYTATITNGAKNPAGIALANDYEWSFNTNLPLGPPVIDLKSVARFGIIAGVAVSNDAGFSEIHNMDVGIYPGVRSSCVGFPPAIIVNGAMYAADDIAPVGVAEMLKQAKLDLVAAYLTAEAATSPAPATLSGDQGGKTLAPGIYKTTSSLLVQLGDLTLDAQGDANAVWIFQIASTLDTKGGSPYPSPTGGNIILTGGAQAKNIFWQVASSATIGDYTSFKGNVLALQTITMAPYARAEGRMLAQNGAVTMTSTNMITKP